jgi:hypothetical protein
MVSDNMLMSTSFNNVVPEWDSDDDDDTNSSEEFMYVKGCNLPIAGDVKGELLGDTTAERAFYI